MSNTYQSYHTALHPAPSAYHLASMQRPTTTASTSTSSSTHSQATTSLRRTLRSQPSGQLGKGSRTGHNNNLDEEDIDFIADPRPWESRGSLKSYGSKTEGGQPDLPLYTHSSTNNLEDMDVRRRYGEKEGVIAGSSVMPEEKELLDDQGKWMKGHGPGPGVGGRRGLPPRQRIPGWVSLHLSERNGSWLMDQRGVMVEHEEWIWTGVYTALALFTRLWKIGAANYVVWDEVCDPNSSTHSTYSPLTAGTFRQIWLPLHQQRFLF
jgi:hypothetical protein